VEPLSVLQRTGSPNASQIAVGAVLAQEVDSLEKVVAYTSHSLTATELRWSTYDRELWPIVGCYSF